MSTATPSTHTRANIVASAFARACVQLVASVYALEHAPEAHGEGGWPVERDAMAVPAWVRARMTEDCVDMISGVDDADTDAFGEHDLRELGWTADQVRAHGRFAFATALVLARPAPAESRARPRAFGEARRFAMGAVLLASFGLVLGCGMTLAALLNA
jgi:hypothetical protein